MTRFNLNTSRSYFLVVVEKDSVLQNVSDAEHMYEFVDNVAVLERSAMSCVRLSNATEQRNGILLLRVSTDWLFAIDKFL